jgi:hypothetical protein
MMLCENLAPIGALDYGRMKSCAYLKDGSFAMRRFFFWGLETRTTKLSFQ